jgi:hypothetical protein
MTKRKLAIAAAIAALPSTAQGGEIKPTPSMLARARETIKPYGANDRLEYHFRNGAEARSGSAPTTSAAMAASARRHRCPKSSALTSGPRISALIPKMAEIRLMP